MPQLLSALNDPYSPFHPSDKAAWNPVPQETAASKFNGERDIPCMDNDLPSCLGGR